MDPKENDGTPKHGPHGPDCRCGMDGFARTGNLAVDTMRFTTWVATGDPVLAESITSMYPTPLALNN